MTRRLDWRAAIGGEVDHQQAPYAAGQRGGGARPLRLRGSGALLLRLLLERLRRLVGSLNPLNLKP